MENFLAKMLSEVKGAGNAGKDALNQLAELLLKPSPNDGSMARGIVNYAEDTPARFGRNVNAAFPNPGLLAERSVMGLLPEQQQARETVANGLLGFAAPIVYHGTPHRFPPAPNNPLGEFDASKIGTGEGAQSYGHGLYQAEARDVATEYKRAGTGLDDLYFQRGSLLLSKKPVPSSLDEAIKKAEETSSGSLYKSYLDDSAAQKMLDWDKPLSQQHPDVLNAIKQAAEARRKQTGWDSPLDMNMRGGELLPTIGEGRLKEAGIPGIRYLDGGSRSAGAGTNNYVVFPGNEHLLKILSRE